MKRVLSLLIAIVFLAALTVPVLAESGDTIVYITRTGSKYHRDGCGYLRSKIETTLEEAVKDGYTPCSRCKPPTLDSSVETESTQKQQTSGYYYQSNSPSKATQQTPAPTPQNKIPTTTYSSNSKSYVSQSSTQQETDDSWAGEFFLFFIAIVGGCSVWLFRAVEKQKRIVAVKEQEKKDSCATQKQFERVAEKQIVQRSGNMTNENPISTSSLPSNETEPLSLCHAPAGVFVGKDGLPAGRGNRKWGKDYTFYSSPSGSCFHKTYRCSGASIPVNAAMVGRRRPCSICKPVLPNLAWYDEYKRIQKTKGQYTIY